jgi:hypothetical protein
MDEHDVDVILDDYIERHPWSRAALMGDQLFQVQMDLLRRMLMLLGPALRRERLDPPAARRVIDTVVYGAPDPGGALERMVEHEARVWMLERAPVTLVVDGEMAEQFANLLGGERP